MRLWKKETSIPYRSLKTTTIDYRGFLHRGVVLYSLMPARPSSDGHQRRPFGSDTMGSAWRGGRPVRTAAPEGSRMHPLRYAVLWQSECFGI